MPSNEDALFVPADSQLPGSAEYDRYFRLVRGRPNLLSWSRSCLRTQRELLAKLPDSRLSPEQRCEFLEGLLLVAHETMESWISAADNGQAR